MSRGTWVMGKEEALGEQGMVAANHPLAAEVGIDVLKRDGNAKDPTLFTRGRSPNGSRQIWRTMGDSSRRKTWRATGRSSSIRP